ncbi:MAG: hypothetical protein J6Q87_05765 [Clostridia bacterium]|nr:hypothetical protein [Clostridia bacterium]
MSTHSQDRSALITALGSDPVRGLCASEADKRLLENGANKLQEKKKRSMLLRFFDQFKDAMKL